MAAKKITKNRKVTKTSAKKPVKKADVLSSFPKFTKTPNSKKSKKVIALFIAFILFLSLLYLGRSLFFVAWVGGRPITRLSVVRQLEKQGGKETLENLITKELILQASGKANITVSKDDVAAEIDKISKMVESQGSTLDAALAAQGQTRAELEENIRLQKSLEKILENDIKISDEDSQKYFEANKAMYGEAAKYDDLKNDIRDQLKQEKLSSAFQSWLAKLKTDSKIIYFVNY